MGKPAYVAAHAAARLEDERRLLAQLPLLPDVQRAWALLMYSAVPRANHLLRTLPPSQSRTYALAHDAALRDTLSALLGRRAPLTSESWPARQATLPHRLGGAGLRSAERIARGAY